MTFRPMLHLNDAWRTWVFHCGLGYNGLYKITVLADKSGRWSLKNITSPWYHSHFTCLLLLVISRQTWQNISLEYHLLIDFYMIPLSSRILNWAWAKFFTDIVLMFLNIVDYIMLYRIPNVTKYGYYTYWGKNYTRTHVLV